MVGGFAAAVNIGARLLFSIFVSFEIAVILAFPVALTFAFVLNRHYVFHAPKDNISTQYARFFLVNLIGLAQILVVSILLARIFFPLIGFVWNAETIAHIVGVLSPVVTSYVLHNQYTFAK